MLVQGAWCAASVAPGKGRWWHNSMEHRAASWVRRRLGSSTCSKERKAWWSMMWVLLRCTASRARRWLEPQSRGIIEVVLRGWRRSARSYRCVEGSDGVKAEAQRGCALGCRRSASRFARMKVGVVAGAWSTARLMLWPLLVWPVMAAEVLGARRGDTAAMQGRRRVSGCYCLLYRSTS